MKQDKGEDNIDVSLDTKSQGTAVNNTTRLLREAKPVFAPGKNPVAKPVFVPGGNQLHSLITQCIQYVL
jgi:hypothetical protein